MSTRRGSAVPTLALAFVLGFAACSPAAPTPTPKPSLAASPSGAAPSTTPSPTADVLAIYREIEDQVIAIRGLQPTKRLVPTVIDEPTLVANLTAEFDRTNKPDDIAKNEALLVALGLLEPGTSLRDAYLELQGSQVVGYYSPEDKALFVVSRSGVVGAIEKVTFAHEFTHALQDQNFVLDSLKIDDLTNGDRSLGRLSLVEGDATATQTEWILAHMTDPNDLAELIAAASDPEMLAAMARAPAFLRETSLFPYQSGLGFIEALRARDGFAAVNAAFTRPPESTAQILHPDLYPGPPTEFDDLSGFATDAGAGWTERTEDTLGEALLSLWLRENGVASGDASTASAGWASDRVALVDSGDELAVLLVTDWVTPGDADEFEDAGRTAVAGQDVAEVIRISTDRVVLVFGTDQAAVDGIAARVRTGGCC
jgi:hypothetical protein